MSIHVPRTRTEVFNVWKRLFIYRQTIWKTSSKVHNSSEGKGEEKLKLLHSRKSDSKEYKTPVSNK